MIEDAWASQRRNLIAELRAEGIRDERVLQAIDQTPREQFVPESQRACAYDNNALGIGCGQTISQPYIVALMTEALQLKGSERILEIGTGSGYQCAILSKLAAEIYSIERIEELSKRAGEVLQRLEVANVHLRVGDGGLGWPEAAPFDGILVTAAAPKIPAPLLEQLADGGVLVLPIGDQQGQTLTAVHREGRRIHQRTLCECRFVPLLGEEGFA